MKKLLTVAAAVTALFASQASAQAFDQAKYFTIDENSVMITEITDKGGTIQGQSGHSAPSIPAPAQLPKPPTGPVINPPAVPGDLDSGLNGALGTANEIVGTIDNIVNLAQKIWDIILANQPVVNIATNYANAVPYGTTHWSQLQGWSRPSTKKYAFSMKNGFGTEVVKVTYQVHWTHEGNFQGKGKFLTGVTVEPINVTAAWGYKVNLVSEVPDSTIANVGTHENPIASMQVQLKWTVHTAFKEVTSKVIYYVQGDGLLQEIGTPFKKGIEIKERERAQELQTKLENVRFD